MTLVYADASALFKLVWEEPESSSLEAYLGDVDLVSSELALVEVPRALRRTAAERVMAVEPMLERASGLLETVAMQPLDLLVLEAAGQIDEVAMRTLDAIHVVTAIYLEPIDAFVTYDVRQAASARLAGLRTIAPGF